MIFDTLLRVRGPKKGTLAISHTEQAKWDVFQHYSGGKARCKDCGLDDIRTLELDHTNNDGAAHRRTINPNSKIPSGGSSTYQWLKRNGFPPGFEVVCANCHRIRGYNRRKSLI